MQQIHDYEVDLLSLNLIFMKEIYFYICEINISVYIFVC